MTANSPESGAFDPFMVRHSERDSSSVGLLLNHGYVVTYPHHFKTKPLKGLYNFIPGSILGKLRYTATSAIKVSTTSLSSKASSPKVSI